MIGAYVHERFPITVFGPLALLLAGAALGGRFEPWRLALHTLGALSLLAQFRIWDDLADRHRDDATHPHRVLVRATSTAPVLCLGIGLLALNVALAARSDAPVLSLWLLALVHAALGASYLLRRGRTILTDQLLLAKYPAFICVLAGGRLLDAPVPVAAAAALIYAGASCYEAWHDPISPLASKVRTTRLQGERS